jgi:hypothetical protein
LVSDIKEENRLRVFGNRVLRKVFGHKGDGVTGEWGTQLETFRDMYPSTL